MVTVEDVRRAALPAGTKLLAGESGLSREVLWAATLRPARPGFAGLRGGEVALISISTLRFLDEKLSVSQAVQILAETGVSAVALLGDIPGDAVQQADQVSLPLFQLPSGTSLSEVEQSINRLVTEHSRTSYQAEQDKYRQLTELAIDGRGLDSIIQKLDSITGKLVILEDDQFQMRSVSRRLSADERQRLSAAFADSAEEVSAWIRTLRRSSTDPQTARFDLPNTTLDRVVAPVTVRNAVAGYISIIGERSWLTESDRLAAARGSVACAIELARERAIVEARQASEAALVEELLGTAPPQEQRIAARAGREGFDESSPHAVMIIALESSGDSGFITETAQLRQRRIEAAGKKVLNELGVTAPFQARPDGLTVIYPAESHQVEDLKAAADLFERALGDEFEEILVYGGIGTPQPGLAGVRASSREAGQALSIAQKTAQIGQVVYFGDLSLYRLLDSLKGIEEVRRFADEVIGRLAKHDAETNSDFIPTLEAYFESLLSVSDTARRLHIHRNTMIYRLNRIQDITSLDLDVADTLLALQLALKIHRLPVEEGEVSR